MLFAASAKTATTTTPTAAASAAAVPTEPPTCKLPAALFQDHHHHRHQLTTMAVVKGKGYCPIAAKLHHHQQQKQQQKQKQPHQPGERIAGKSLITNNNNLNNNGKPAELMEAMKKLDADLAALFAAAEPLEQLKKQQQKKQAEEEVLWPQDQELALGKLNGIGRRVTEELFKRVRSLQLDLEALTLQAEGTQRMELMQSEVRPIFTVECQLSYDLVRQVPRHDMFQIMQFESEKFQSLTQCTRFGQAAQRQVRLPQGEGEGEDAKGHIDFTVWWREPGTCLNEMLGMGRLELAELYTASLLEQCKCIVIQRRGQHLASLYLKISLKTADAALEKLVGNGNEIAATNLVIGNNNNNAEHNHCSDDATKGHQAAATNKNNNNNNNKSNSGSNKKSNSPGKNHHNNNKNNNNKISLDSVNFMAETTKVRLLRGYICASETRQLSPSDASNLKELVLQPFWQPQTLRVQADANASFQLQEQFAIINDEKFLQCVERQQLVLELLPLGGVVRLPLHQFFIAYRDASITNHLCKGKLPVISIDGWLPICHPTTRVQLGELKCLLAIGSEAQIAQLKEIRARITTTAASLDNANITQLGRTADLLDMLQNALSQPKQSATNNKNTVLETSTPSTAGTTSNSGHFSFNLHIAGAAGLPLNPGYGKTAKKQAKRQATAKQRFPPNEPPNTYVTLQAVSCNAPTYKSHEGLVYATPIVEKSTTPQWGCKFQVSVTRDYLTNPQKLFILKLWKKATSGTGTAPVPTPLEDAIIGFAALNLNPNAKGIYPSGWHNIVDFNGRVTGGLEAHVQPIMEPRTAAATASSAAASQMDTAIDQFEQSLELTHLHLGQAIKRKFTELEQISQRLRTRLVDVTGETMVPQLDIDTALDNWQPTAGLAPDDDDDLVADFERALRTPTPTPPEQSPGE